MTKYLMLLTVTLFSVQAFAKTDFNKEALKYVPNGTVEVVEGDEVKVKTGTGTFVEIEFNRDGTLGEASGNLATKDTFTPGNGLLSLKDAVAAAEKAGKKVEGEWNLDKDLLREWEYEFEGFEDNKKFEYVINAKSGELLKSKRD